MAPVPFTFTGSLQFPADPGGAAALIAIAFAANYNQLIAETLALSGSGTKALDLSALNAGAGASLFLLKVDPQSVSQTLNLRWNSAGASGEQEVSTGGFFVVGSPSPSAGLAALSLVWTMPMTVRFWALGL